MAKIKYLCIHCSATPENVAYTGDDIKDWHKRKGWKVVGYHWFIGLDGEVEELHEINDDNILQRSEVVNGCWGINSKSLHVCYCGGLGLDFKPKDTRNQEQRESLEALIKNVIRAYPDIKVLGHNQAIHPSREVKACPSFDVATWLYHIGIDEKNIEHRANIFKQ